MMPLIPKIQQIARNEELPPGSKIFQGGRHDDILANGIRQSGKCFIVILQALFKQGELRTGNKFLQSSLFLIKGDWILKEAARKSFLVQTRNAEPVELKVLEVF